MCTLRDLVPLAAILTAVPLFATPIYQVTTVDLGAAGMNNLGDVVGANSTGSFVYRYASGTYFDVSNLRGYPTTPVAINDRGSLAGSLVYSDGSTRAFFNHFTGFLDIINPLPGQTRSTATQLNNIDRVIGNSLNPGLEGFLFFDFLPASGLGAQTNPNDINDSNVVVGYVYSSQGQRAFMSSGGTFTNLGVLDPSHTTSSAAGINDNGDIVGYSYNNSTAQSFLYRNGAMTALPQMGGNRPTLAKDINNDGVIIGDYVSTTGVRQFVIVDGLIYDINELIDPAWTGGPIFGSSVAINNAGQILIRSNTVAVSYLLTPTAGSGGGGAGEVPEPATWTLAAAGLGAAALTRSRRR